MMILHPDDDSSWIGSSRTFGICVLHWSWRLGTEKALQLAFMVLVLNIGLSWSCQMINEA